MRLARWLGHPTRVIPAAYLVAIAVGTGLLLLPAATTAGRSAEFIDAMFTAVSAVCITGLISVDTATFWSPFGQAVVLLLIQIGGFGIVTLATLLTLVATGRVSWQRSLLASQELHQRNLSTVLRLPARIGLVMLVAEAVTATLLAVAFRRYSDGWGSAIWHGVFHAVSAFNNAGFALYSDNLTGFVGDPGIILPISLAVIVGGIGFPVLFELARCWRSRGRVRWSVHARLTVFGTLILLTVGMVGFAAFEWSNPGTLGALPVGDRLLASVAGGVFPRTAGFNSIDYGLVREPTIGMNYLLMFIGGGSAGTAGGVKIGTVGIVIAVVIAELRGETQVVVSQRAVPSAIVRSALTVIALGATVVLVGTILLAEDRFSLQQVLFEAFSAFGTVGLSTGITPHLRPESLVVLMVLMYLGRVGTISFATALALRARRRHYLLPEEQPIVG
ncbi:MAG: TrkH family potassium uptake protein [Propionibacteriaceae bacterium]|nr:TrkH family potassium uptake protein [Propionibacteriaceae bacterium]